MSRVVEEYAKRVEIRERLEVADALLRLCPPDEFPLARAFRPRESSAMDRIGIGHAVCPAHIPLFGWTCAGLAHAGPTPGRKLHEDSNERVHSLIAPFFNPEQALSLLSLFGKYVKKYRGGARSAACEAGTHMTRSRPDSR